LAAPPPVVIKVKDRQLAVLVGHLATMTRRLAKAQRRGQATVSGGSSKGRQQSTKKWQ